jgi:conjugal transfer mating pair stabilization protein TraN
MRLFPLLAGLTLSLSAGNVVAQTMQQAKDDGKAFGQAQGSANVGAADTDAAAQSTLPGYNGANAPQTVYMTDPAALDAAKPAVAATNPGYRLTVDGNLTRPQVNPAEIDATVARGNAVNQDPATYAPGLANGTSGQCVPLPPSTTTTGTFEATCNKGLALETGPRSCPITLTHNFGPAGHKYQCTRIHTKGQICLQGTPNNCTEPDFVDDITGSGCEAYEAAPICTMAPVSSQVILAGNFRRASTTFETFQATCSSDVQGTLTGSPMTVGTSTYTPSFADLGSTQAYLGSTQDVSQCTALVNDTGCTAPVDVCTDTTPATRTINGFAVTQSCWAWSRDYTCTGTKPANDCSAGTIPQGCTFNREECLDDPAPADPAQCQVFQEVYTCPIVGPGPKDQFVCGGDVYCINGDCEPIVREASTEFKDALVGLHTLSETSKNFNSIDYTLFKGTGTTCSKPVFGLGNCCGGNGFPLIGTCSSADRLLAQQIDKGLTHYVGTYCAHSFIVCTTKAQSYCVFGSKLTRILQEQGRQQISKTWGTAKKPDCSGFTVDQFASLDLSVMNFAEIYQDFIQAAKLPDEAATLTDIQAKITAYYTRGP